MHFKPKTMTDSDSGTIEATEEAHVVKFDIEQKVVGYAGFWEGNEHRADSTDRGLQFTASGRPSQNEQNVAKVAHIFSAHLREAKKLRCGEPALRVSAGAREESGIDFVVHDGDCQFNCQVTRPRLAGDGGWRQRARQTIVSAGVTPREAAEAIYNAIENKSWRTAPADRQKITLIIDATEAPHLILDDVRDQFRHHYSHACAARGFAAVYVVGPSPSCVFRLT